LTSARDARGMGVTLGYTDWGTTVTDASGRQVRVHLRDGLIQRIVLPDGRHVSYGYHDGRLSYVVDARGHKWIYRYDGSGLLAEVVDPTRVVAVHNEYGADGRMVAQRDGAGSETTFAWDSDRQEAATTDADGVTVWDGQRGNVLVYSQRATGDADNHRYDERLDRNLVVNGGQHQHEATFDANNNPIEHTDGNGNV